MKGWLDGQPAQDWELESIASFLDLIYSSLVRCNERD